MKLRTARAMKWNVLDRVATQVLYAVTGIVLARELTAVDMGLVGAVMIFQAFASLFVDSGFSFALIQYKRPSRLDYSSVLWFNMGVATFLYIILYVCAPLIADCFGDTEELVPLSRVMFLSLIVNASAIVQTNRFMKQMNVKPVAYSNAVGLTAGSVAGIYMAVSGFGAWTVVAQTLVLGSVKSMMLWGMSRWVPVWTFSWKSLKKFLPVGTGMMMTSFLNTLFLNLYAFFIGNRAGIGQLGYYTQADKWSKMGISSLSQVLTSTFVPALSSVQDDRERFVRMMRKMTRMTSYITLPALIGLAIIALPLFRLLFGTRWDASVVLFQLLCVRGVFTVMAGLYNNFLLALGRSRLIFYLEIVRDAASLIALVLTFPVLAVSTDSSPVYGVEILLWGQLGATVLSWLCTLIVTAHATGLSAWAIVNDSAPYFGLTLLMGAIATAIVLGLTTFSPLVAVSAAIAAGAVIYLGISAILRSRVQADVLAYFRGKL